MFVHGLWLEGASWDRKQSILVEPISSAVYEMFPVIKVTTIKKSEAEIEADAASDFEDNPELSKRELREMERKEKELATAAEVMDTKHNKSRSSNMNSQKDFLKKTGSGKTLKSGASGAQDSSFNFQMQKQPDESEKDQEKMNDTNAPFKTTNPNDTKKSSAGKMFTQGSKQFAEDYNVDDVDEDSYDEEYQKTYYYKCPVFRTTLRLRTGEISSDNKPVFYVTLPTYTHPRRWIKRSVALLMETGR